MFAVVLSRGCVHWKEIYLGSSLCGEKQIDAWRASRKGGHAESYGSRLLVSIKRRIENMGDRHSSLGRSYVPLVQNAQLPCSLGAERRNRYVPKYPTRLFRGKATRLQDPSSPGGAVLGWSLPSLKDAINESCQVEWHVRRPSRGQCLSTVSSVPPL